MNDFWVRVCGRNINKRFLVTFTVTTGMLGVLYHCFRTRSYKQVMGQGGVLLFLLNEDNWL